MRESSLQVLSSRKSPSVKVILFVRSFKVSDDILRREHPNSEGLSD